jgi:hypothetical protein
MSSVAGESLQTSVSESIGEGLSLAGGDDDVNPLRTGGRSRSHSKSISQKFEAIVRPEDFRNLQDGEAIFIGRSDVFKLRVPLVTLNQDNKSLDFPRFRRPYKEGLCIAEKYHNFTAGV